MSDKKLVLIIVGCLMIILSPAFTLLFQARWVYPRRMPRRRDFRIPFTAFLILGIVMLVTIIVSPDIY